MVAPQRSRLLALVLAALTFVGSTGAWHAPDDPDCFDGIVLHDHSAHHERFGKATQGSTPEHCAICHWLQSFRIGSTARARVPFASGTFARFAAALRPLPVSVSAAAISPRGPPLA